MSEMLMRPELKDDFGILELQNKILEVACYIDAFCRENDIEYCLMGGSALGAARHGGFIPWDDDLDIFMTPDNYEKFRAAFYEKGDKNRFYLQQFGLSYGMTSMAKLRMNGTTYIEHTFRDYDMHHGIYVDIFILHACPDNRLKQLHQCLWAKYVIMRGSCNRRYRGQKWYIQAVLFMMRIFPKRFLLNFALRQVYRYNGKPSQYYCNFLGKAVFRQGIYKRSWMEGSVYHPFETVRLKVPRDLEHFLRFRFGDYMRIPSPEKIKREQHAWKWDTEKDFRCYVNCVSSYKDEINVI